MAEYIEREAAISCLFSAFKAYWDVPRTAEDRAVQRQACEARDRIKGLTAADVVEVKRGRWKYIGGDEWCCSCCGFVASTEGRWEPMMAKFCEECGADMREGDQ